MYKVQGGGVDIQDAANGQGAAYVLEGRVGPGHLPTVMLALVVGRGLAQAPAVPDGAPHGLCGEGHDVALNLDGCCVRLVRGDCRG